MPQQTTKSRLLNFSLIWFGQLISGVGSGLTSFTLGVYVYQRIGSATKFTFVFLAASEYSASLTKLMPRLPIEASPTRFFNDGTYGMQH